MGKLQDVISFVTFAQFASTCYNIGIVLMFLIFYVKDLMDYVYYGVYVATICLEIFPCCYYGSILMWELDNLPYALFRCKWLEQSKGFRQNVLLFSQSTMRETRLLASGIIGINLDAFFGTIKMAYSLFTVMLQLKE